MKELDLLKKYRYETKINKTDLYSYVNSNSKKLIELGFDYKVKNEFDLFGYEIIIKGIDNKNIIEECYNKFLINNYDIFEYINYEEKRKILCHDQEQILSSLIGFCDKTSKEMIYLPYLEPFINKYYLNDYQLIILKQHSLYIKEYEKSIKKVIDLYGIQVFESDFSSLQLVGDDDENEYFYHDNFKVVYQFDKQTSMIKDEIYLIDKYTKEYPDLLVIKEAVNLIKKEDNQLIDYLYNNKFIGDKTYKKIIKKLKKVSK